MNISGSLLNKGAIMSTKEIKERLTVLFDADEFAKFKKIAEEQNRTAGNLAATVIKDFLKNYKS